jgi:DNA-binding CsgD family transcriptional regulator
MGAVDARAAVWPLHLTLCAEFGWMDSSDVRLMMSALRDPRAVDEMAMAMARDPGGNESGVLTATALGKLGEAGWRRNRLYDFYLRPVGVDDVIQSRMSGVLGAQRHGWIALVRDRSDGLFTERDALVVDALHSEVGSWLWKRVGADLARAGDAEPNGATPGVSPTGSSADLLARLSPTQRKVLPYLLKGCTEEEIAVDLNRSKHTVHDHAKRIYDALGVKSRIDLVITFQNAGWDGRSS